MANQLTDQAAGLRGIQERRAVRVVAVTSGKGGVGKTSVSVNLAMSMGRSGRRVVLMDADLGLANVDVMLGLQPRYNITHVLQGTCALDDILIDAPHGVRVVPASSGTRQMAALTSAEHAGLIRAFSSLRQPVDALIVDVAAGISNSVLDMTQAAQEVVVVVCDEPASITDAYALIKVLSRDFGVTHFRVLANMVSSSLEGRELYNKIAKVTDRYLDVCLQYMGAVPYDEYLRKALQRQRAVVDIFPSSPSARAFKSLAAQADNWPVPRGARGRLEFFVERLIGAHRQPVGAIP